MPLFLVRRKVARGYPRDDIPDPVAQYAATLTTRAAAEELARQLDREEKRAATDPSRFVGTHDDPFQDWCTWADISMLPPLILRDWLRDENIEPPPELKLRRGLRQRAEPFELVAWRAWWEELVRRNDLTATQWERVWLGLNRHCLYEVVEAEPNAELRAVEVEPDKPATVFAVVRCDWEYNDNWFNGENAAVEAFRTHDAAEQRRATLEAEGLPEYRESGPYEFVVIELPLDEYAG